VKRLILGIMVAAFIFGADLAPAKAAEDAKKTPVINKRQNRQKRRIREGVHSGDLTKDEAKQLRTEQKTVTTEKKAAKADGVVTKQEREKIRADQGKASKDIRKEKTDTQKKH
jgi:hypothetical protein